MNITEKSAAPTALAPASGSTTCNECGGNHEPSGARIACINHWKRRAIIAENELLVAKCFGDKTLDWLVDNVHKIEVDCDAAYCDEQQKPALSFRSLKFHDYRPWCVKGESRGRLRDALRKIMALQESPNEITVLKSALERIRSFPVHSEPVGGAYAMQDIAHEALSSNDKLSD